MRGIWTRNFCHTTHVRFKRDFCLLIIYNVCLPLVSIGNKSILKKAAINRPPDA